MKHVNVIFEGELSDVDIISVPDDVAINIEAVVQTFFDWVFEPENKQMFEKLTDEGKIVVSIGTHEFIWWLNKYRTDHSNESTIVKEHTVYCSEYPSAEF